MALGALACAAAALVYRSALDNPFVFDDRVTVLLNPSLVDPGDIAGVLFHNPARPVVNASYAFDGWVWGFSSFGFHVTNLVLHVVVVGLFYGWCTRALRDQGPRTQGLSDQGASDQGPEWPAFFAATIFGLHPALTQAVEYISARSELLGALGFLAALICARRAIIASSVSAGAIAACFGLVALGASAAAAALPVVALAYDAWVLREAGWRRRFGRVYLPSMAVVALVAAWRLRTVLAADRVPPRTLIDNLLTEGIVVWRYVALLLVPSGQAAVHDVRWVTTPADPIALLALAGLVAGVAAAIRVRRSAPLVAFGATWLFTTLAPTSSLVPLRDAMAEQRPYLATAGLLLAAASALARPLATRRSLGVVAAVAIVILAVLTRARSVVWSEPFRLWQEAVQRAPGTWQAHYEYAETLREAGQCQRALAEYDAAVRLNPHLGPAAALRAACDTRPQ